MGWVLSRTRNGKERHTASYRDASGHVRSAGTFDAKKQALAAIRRQEVKLGDGTWIDPAAGRITFGEYAMDVWLPSRHIEVSTRAGYVSNLRAHFVPFFGEMPMNRIVPSTVQAWVSEAVDKGLSPRSIGMYHTMLHSIFARAVRDRMLAFNPCAATELPKVVLRKGRILTPAEFERLLAEIPERFTVLVQTAIETGLRWGELAALRPEHVDFLRRTITVQETIVEVSRKDSPTGERLLVKPYPKDNEPRTLRVSDSLLQAISGRIATLGLGRHDLLFPSTETAGGQLLAANRRPGRDRLQRPRPRPAPRPRLVAARRRRRPRRSHGTHGPRPDHHHPQVPTHPARRR